MIEVVETLHHGVALFAAQDIPKALIIIDEPYLTFIPKPFYGDDASKFQIYSGLSSTMWAQYFNFLDQSAANKVLILNLYSPIDGLTAVKTKAAIISFLSGFSPRNSIPGGKTAAMLNADEMLKVTMVYHFNAASVKPSDVYPQGGSSLFVLACRLSHSCCPNCAWSSSPAGNRIVQSTLAISLGEELTIDYLNGTQLLHPSWERRAFLCKHYEFTCDCAYCREQYAAETRQSVGTEW